MEKLVVVIMGDFCTQFMDMCFKSVLEADKIIFLWGTEDTPTMNKFFDWKDKYPDKFELLELYYDQENKMQNGTSRNYYLEHLKKNYKNWNCLVLDVDEVLSDNGVTKIKEFMVKND